MTTPDLPTPTSDALKHAILLRRVDQAAIATLVGGSLLLIASWGLLMIRPTDGVIDIQEQLPLPLHFQVDINSADWVELSLLPNIGQVLAERIIESRDTQGPFTQLDDLQRVPGIGPKTMDSIRRYLRPLPEGTPTADP